KGIVGHSPGSKAGRGGKYEPGSHGWSPDSHKNATIRIDAVSPVSVVQPRMRQRMDKEREIKMRDSPPANASLRELRLLNRRRTGEWHTGTLYNQYYDTAERDVALARVALRVRRDGEQYIQTLKSKGQSVAGLSERNEWDWPTDGPGLDLTLLDDSCWPASLAALDKLLLQPVFTTDFQRTKALLNWEHEGQPVQVEV